MRPKDLKFGKSLETRLNIFEKEHGLPGIDVESTRSCFLEQLVESERRYRFIEAVSRRPTRSRSDPCSPIFDPIRGAIWHVKNGNVESASWLIFASVHFGQNRKTGWRLAATVLSGLGKTAWTWDAIRNNAVGFRKWLRKNRDAIEREGGKFGNHRKYQNLDADSNCQTGAAVQTYVEWVLRAGSHRKLFSDAVKVANSSPSKSFDSLYGSMTSIASFGRTARFDYLVMIGKLGIADIEPGHLYLDGATGPLAGARLLLGGDTEAPIPKTELNELSSALATTLDIKMHVLEDALCNWQKSPARFRAYRG